MGHSHYGGRRRIDRTVMKTIFLIRHGESTSDVEDRYGGDYDDHLTEKGRSQAREIAQNLNGTGIENFFVSPKLRAKETAEILAAVLGCGMEIIEDMREQNYYAALTGMRRKEAALRFPQLVAMLPHADMPLPGAEPRQEFIGRVRAAFTLITSAPYHIIGIVTHAGPIRRITDEILRLGEITHIDRGAIITLDDDGTRWRIVESQGISLRPSSV